jgi:hypothetical protein
VAANVSEESASSISSERWLGSSEVGAGEEETSIFLRNDGNHVSDYVMLGDNVPKLSPS